MANYLYKNGIIEESFGTGITVNTGPMQFSKGAGLVTVKAADPLPVELAEPLSVGAEVQSDISANALTDAAKEPLRVNSKGELHVTSTDTIYKGKWAARNLLADRALNNKDEILTDEKGRLLSSMEGLFVTDPNAETDLSTGDKKEILIDVKGRQITAPQGLYLNDVDLAALAAPASGAKSNFLCDEKGRLVVKVQSPDIVDHIDGTGLIDFSADTMMGNGGAFLEVVASTEKNVTSIQVVEDAGVYYGIYTGAIGLEDLKAIPPLGGGITEVNIPVGTRVSVRGLEAANTTIGKMAWNLRG